MIPPLRRPFVSRPSLLERLESELDRKLTLISAPAGFGKTTLLSEWADRCDRPVAWLSLEESEGLPERFLFSCIAALQRLEPSLGQGAAAALQTPQLPAFETVLALLFNEIKERLPPTLFILDDVHLISGPAIDQLLAFFLKHLPTGFHLVLATREDLALPLARLRLQRRMLELRADDLRFTTPEITAFLHQVMDLRLSKDAILALERRTEGWIAGLQLAALALQGKEDGPLSLTSVDGTHPLIADYLLEEVLQKQPLHLQRFLLQTSFLDRLCGPLCEAVLQDPGVSGQGTLEIIERANLFLRPLDKERRWYRYHPLFAAFLRQRGGGQGKASAEDQGLDLAERHHRASVWYEEEGLAIEAFHHAVQSKDLPRIADLVEGKGMPLHFRGAVHPVLEWLSSLPREVLEARPSLGVIHASALLFVGQFTGVEPKLQAAEKALQDAEDSEEIRDLRGHIAAIRATLAAAQMQVERIVSQSRLALGLLRPDNLPIRASMFWTLGHAYHLQGERAAAAQAYTEAVARSLPIGHTIILTAATLGLGRLHEGELQPRLAVQAYESLLEGASQRPPPVLCEAHLGLARIAYARNDLTTAQTEVEKSIRLAQHLEATDRIVACLVVLARTKVAAHDLEEARAFLEEARHRAKMNGVPPPFPEIATVEVLLLLQQGQLARAEQIAREEGPPLSQARVLAAQGARAEALDLLASLRRHAEEKGWQDERLSIQTFQAVVLFEGGDMKAALSVLDEILEVALPGGLIRLFLEEGAAMARLLAEKRKRGPWSEGAERLLLAFPNKGSTNESEADEPRSRVDAKPQPLLEPLSLRELSVLELIAQGFSNAEIGKRLFVAESTIKGHNQSIFAKLAVRRRTEAVARARALGLLHPES